MDSEFAQSRKSSLESELEQVNGELAAIENELNKLYARHEILKERQSLLQVQIQSLDQVALEEETARHQSIDWEQGRFPWTDTVYSILRDTFKLNQFRPLQLSCINATLSQKDTVLIMPTGGGKSLCYQLPAVANKGFSLVISPLVALMEDQLISVRRFGIESAMLNASSPREEVNRVHAAMTDTGKESLKLLYVTPEKISKSKRFMAKLEKAYDKKKLTGIIIDEVHCASQWGHDFRPDYKILGILKRQFPSVPIVGLTATATSKVLEDCKAILNLKSCLVFKASYNRPNLVYDVRYKPSGFQDQLEQIAELIKLKFAKQSGIVYCFSQKDSEQISTELCKRNISAVYYHGRMEADSRTRAHFQWINNNAQVMVATVAFGMGIDKPDVRFIIHHSVSKSIENYYQESGRAGRDGLLSSCILYYRANDAFRQSTMVFQEHTGLRNLYNMLRYCLNKSECRRAIIARHFGEEYTKEDCSGNCDVCKAGGEIHEVDYTPLCQAFIQILDQSKAKDQQLTALKLIEASKSSCKMSLEERERVLVHCILEGVFKEVFHFTPYSTISYIAPEKKSRAVVTGHIKISLPSVRHTGKVTTRGPSGNTVATGSTSTPRHSTPEHSTQGSSKQGRSEKQANVSKRAAPQELSDHDESSLTPNSKKYRLSLNKKGKGKGKERQQLQPSSVCASPPILIDDSSDSD